MSKLRMIMINVIFDNFKQLDYSYSLIANHYGDKIAKRSGVKLINHIDEGIKILILLGAKELTEYFNEWMKILDISEEKYQSILEKLNEFNQ